MKGIDIQQLSKTVQDAIYITQKLGVEYLWVDSLCIVQDDKQDWLAEAPRMGSIYERSYLTLAATAAKNESGGLFAPLQDDRIVRLPCDPEDPDKGDMYFAPPDIAFTEVRESPLTSRGWVLQERLLSRRTIHFAATQIYWECRDEFIAERGDTENMMKDSLERGQNLRQSLSAYEHRRHPDEGGGQSSTIVTEERSLARSYGKSFGLHRSWRSIIMFYSTCGLTFQSDKLPALLGLATEIQSRTGLDYQFGHWIDNTVDTLASLLWMASGTPMKTLTLPRAPSWSWAALNGAIEFMIDGMDMTRLEENPSDLQLLRVNTKDPMYPDRVGLQFHGLLRGVTRCRTYHDRPNTTFSSGLYPRTCYYHIGNGCDPEYQWFPTPRVVKKGASNINWLEEIHARLYPQAAPLPPPDGVSWPDEGEEEVLILPPPGIGWVCFDCAEFEPTEFYLAHVFTRQFISKNKQRTPQYLALALVKEKANEGGTQYRRVGVAQIHKQDWLADTKKEEFTLI